MSSSVAREGATEPGTSIYGEPQLGANGSLPSQYLSATSLSRSTHPPEPPDMSSLTSPAHSHSNHTGPLLRPEDEDVAALSMARPQGPGSPQLVVQEPDGNAITPAVDDNKNGIKVPSESGESDEGTPTSSIGGLDQVNDAGLGDYAPHNPAVNADGQPLYGLLVGSPSADGQELPVGPSLKGVGDFLPNHAGRDPTRHEVAQFNAEHVFSNLNKPNTDIQNTMDSRLRKAVQKANLNQEVEYLPLDSLWSIINLADTKLLLSSVYPNQPAEEIDRLAHLICGPSLTGTGRRRLLGILVLIDMVLYIDRFIEDDVCDKDLPLKVEYDNDFNYYRIHKKAGESFTLLAWCMEWRNTVLKSFGDTQRAMLVPFFKITKDNLFYYPLDPCYVLPFNVHERMTKGGYGTVSKIQIHPAHHNGRDDRDPDINPFFALKDLHSNDLEDLEKEVKVLARFSRDDDSHDHLIRLLLTFRHGDKSYLLFPWADGDLKDFWNNSPVLPIDPINTRWIVGQCLGLAQALRKIHRATSGNFPEKEHATDASSFLAVEGPKSGRKEYGRHGDIKPENILYFKKERRFVISDFGLSKYHSKVSKSHDGNDNLAGFSPTYRPPEVDLRQNISQRYDVWALGCVFLEFLSWFIASRELRELDFSELRIQDDVTWGSVLREDKFFTIVGDGKKEQKYHGIVKPSVKKWISQLRDDARCPKFAHDFLNLIENFMLVPDSKERAGSDLVVRQLKRILARCEDESYCSPSDQLQVTGVVMPGSQVPEMAGHSQDASTSVVSQPTNPISPQRENGLVTTPVTNKLAAQVVDVTDRAEKRRSGNMRTTPPFLGQPEGRTSPGSQKDAMSDPAATFTPFFTRPGGSAGLESFPAPEGSSDPLAKNTGASNTNTPRASFTGVSNGKAPPPDHEPGQQLENSRRQPSSSRGTMPPAPRDGDTHTADSHNGALNPRARVKGGDEGDSVSSRADNTWYSRFWCWCKRCACIRS